MSLKSTGSTGRPGWSLTCWMSSEKFASTEEIYCSKVQLHSFHAAISASRVLWSKVGGLGSNFHHDLPSSAGCRFKAWDVAWAAAAAMRVASAIHCSCRRTSSCACRALICIFCHWGSHPASPAEKSLNDQCRKENFQENSNCHCTNWNCTLKLNPRSSQNATWRKAPVLDLKSPIYCPRFSILQSVLKAPNFSCFLANPECRNNHGEAKLVFSSATMQTVSGNGHTFLCQKGPHNRRCSDMLSMSVATEMWQAKWHLKRCYVSFCACHPCHEYSWKLFVHMISPWCLGFAVFIVPLESDLTGKGPRAAALRSFLWWHYRVGTPACHLPEDLCQTHRNAQKRTDAQSIIRGSEVHIDRLEAEEGTNSTNPFTSLHETWNFPQKRWFWENLGWDSAEHMEHMATLIARWKSWHWR